MFNFGLSVSLIQSPNRLIENANITKKIAGKKVIHHSPENKKSFPNLIKVPKDGVVGGTPTPKKLRVDSAMIKFLLIAFGGGLGASMRFLINDVIKTSLFSFPSGILVVNFIGCFLIGIAMAQITDFKSNLYYFLIIGFLGSFTTMSAFSQQTIEMLYNGKDFNALIYVVISIASCLMGTYLAYFLFKTS